MTEWMPVELPLRKLRLGGARRYYRNRGITSLKLLMTKLGFTLYYDYTIDPRVNTDDKIIILLSPENKQYASWIVMQWEPK